MKQRPAPPNPLLRCLQPLHIVYTKLMLIRTQDRNLLGLNNLTKAHNALDLTIPCPPTALMPWERVSFLALSCCRVDRMLFWSSESRSIHGFVISTVTLRPTSGTFASILHCYPLTGRSSINQLIGGSG